MNAKDVMTRDVVSIDPDSTVLQAARLMLQHHISGLPVIDSAGKLVGVLSEGDFLRRRETDTERRRSRWLEFLMGPGKIASEYTRSHGSKVSEVMTDEEQLLTEMQKQKWAPAAMVNVVVQNGVVELWGAIIDDRQRNALKVAAENIPGVKGVKDHLVWVEPTSGMVIEPQDNSLAH
jgi:CBS-domain-containing membrane protein